MFANTTQGIRWASNKLGPDCSEQEKLLEITNGGEEGSPATPGFISVPEPRGVHTPAPGLLKQDGKKPLSDSETK